MALLGGRVTATDLAPNLPLLRANCEASGAVLMSLESSLRITISLLCSHMSGGLYMMRATLGSHGSAIRHSSARNTASASRYASVND